MFVIVIRKFFNGNDYHSIDLKIGRFLSKFIPKHSFSKIITVSQSFQSIFKGMFPTADLFDYQHGLISDKYIGYVEGNGVSKHLISNKCKVLLYGEGFKHKLMKFKDGCYFEKYSAVVGSPYSLYINSFDSFNYSILFTLQFTSSHDQKVNQFFLEKHWIF